MSGWSEEDTMSECDVRRAEVDQAWHDARDAAAANGDLPERNRNKVSDSEDGSFLHEVFVTLGLLKK